LDSNPRATEANYQGDGIQVPFIQQHLANMVRLLYAVTLACTAEESQIIDIKSTGV
jgi:hypothetical protein